MKYTIAEYSASHNIPKSKIYSLIKGKLKDSVVRENGKLYIVIDDKVEDSKEEVIIEQVKHDTEEKSKEEYNNNQAEIERAYKEIEALKLELAKEKENNREIEKRLLDMMEQVIELTRNNQILIVRAQEQQQLLLDGQKQAEPAEKKRKGLFSWLKIGKG